MGTLWPGLSVNASTGSNFVDQQVSSTLHNTNTKVNRECEQMGIYTTGGMGREVSTFYN